MINSEGMKSLLDQKEMAHSWPSYLSGFCNNSQIIE